MMGCVVNGDDDQDHEDGTFLGENNKKVRAAAAAGVGYNNNNDNKNSSIDKTPMTTKKVRKLTARKWDLGDENEI